MIRLAVISTHPIQYYAPWFKYLAKQGSIDLKIFYLWDFGVTAQVDSGFKQVVQWDVPLLAGYEHEFVKNCSSDPGTHHFRGLQNPTLSRQVKVFAPDAVLLLGYNFQSFYHFLWHWRTNDIPLLFRGDSHRLIKKRGPKEWLRQQFLTKLFQQFSAFLYVGEANRQYFEYHGVDEEQLFFSPHSVNNDWFISQQINAKVSAVNWKNELGIPEGKLVFLFAGKFEVKKRPLDLLQAFCDANLDNAVLLFVGSGSLETELRERVRGQPNIFFAPFQNQSQMPKVYLASDIFVLPSYGSGETWGLAVNEAMCFSRPIIVSSHVGCAQDLVHPYENGLLFPAGDIKALSNCLKEAVSSRGQLELWGKRSYQIIQDFSYEKATQGVTTALNFVLEKL